MCKDAAKAVDPDSLNPDPDTGSDPASQVNQDPMQIEDFDDEKLKKKKNGRKFFYICF
jgi:hypothetical protein